MIGLGYLAWTRAGSGGFRVKVKGINIRIMIKYEKVLGIKK